MANEDDDEDEEVEADDDSNHALTFEEQNIEKEKAIQSDLMILADLSKYMIRVKHRLTSKLLLLDSHDNQSVTAIESQSSSSSSIALGSKENTRKAVSTESSIDTGSFYGYSSMDSNDRAGILEKAILILGGGVSESNPNLKQSVSNLNRNSGNKMTQDNKRESNVKKSVRKNNQVSELNLKPKKAW